MSIEHFRSTGRCELIGNHTDHQHGRVMACAVDLFMDAFVEKTDDDRIVLESENFGTYTVELSISGVREAEKGKTEALIRGMAEALKDLGFCTGGFKGTMTSRVLPGSGVSSSAAFEVLVGRILSGLYNDGEIPDETIAIAGQIAENDYFGKPCGLMDQMAVSLGGMVYIDFADPAAPVVEKLGEGNENFFRAHGYSICIVNTGGSHADLTAEYAAIPAEMNYVAGLFGKGFLRDVDRDAFEKMMANMPKPERPFLRTKHFFDENDRVALAAKAVKENDMDLFLKLLRESGISSRELLQNITPSGADKKSLLAEALELSESLLAGKGAVRVHGGGFAGTIMAVVPDRLLADFADGMEKRFGKASCTVVNCV